MLQLNAWLFSSTCLQWDVAPWGSWRVFARNSEYEALVEAHCESPGTPLRAPTADRGLDVFCRDSFYGQVSGKASMSAVCVRLMLALMSLSSFLDSHHQRSSSMSDNSRTSTLLSEGRDLTAEAT